MGKILDLRPMLAESFELVLSDSDTLHLEKPNEAMMMEIAQLHQRQQDGKGDVLGDLNLINGLLVQILNRNKDGKRVNLEMASSFPWDAKIAIIMAYTEWAMSYNSPNSNAPSSPDAMTTGAATH